MLFWIYCAASPTFLQLKPGTRHQCCVCCYRRGMTNSELPSGNSPELPERHLTLNQVVAYNLAAYRKAAEISQDEIGQRIGGWSAASVSAAERSWDSKRVKKFDADEILAIAHVLGVPLAALFLPPEDDGTACRYVLDLHGPGSELPLRDLLPLAVGQVDTEAVSLAAAAYIKRLIMLGWRPQVGATVPEQRATDQGVEALEQERERLERKISDLRRFEHQYRTRLLKFIESNFKELSSDAIGVDPDEVFTAMRDRVAGSGNGTMTALLLDDSGAWHHALLDKATGKPSTEAGDDGGQRLSALPLSRPGDQEDPWPEVPQPRQEGARRLVLPVRRPGDPR